MIFEMNDIECRTGKHFFEGLNVRGKLGAVEYEKVGTDYSRLKCATFASNVPLNCAACATGRRTFKLMTFNAKLHCTRRESGLERGLTHKMYPSENRKEKKE